MRLVAVDPGIRGCGVAVFESDANLLTAGYVRNPSLTGSGPEECRSMSWAVETWLALAGGSYRVVVEWPQVYRTGRGRGDPNDLLPLAGVGAALATLLPASVLPVKPSEWKGQVPKTVMVARVRGRLSDAELAHVVLPSPSLAHNVWDAIGIGLHSLGRLHSRR